MAIINQPSLLPGEFASDGDKNVIPANNDGLSGLASIAKGFPPITQQPLASGGLPPQRADFNGIFNLISQFLLYSQNGGVFTYSATLDYNPPAMVGDSEGNIYICIAQNGPNTTAGTQATSNASYWVKVINANTLTTILNNYLTLSGGTLTGNLDVSGHDITADKFIGNLQGNADSADKLGTSTVGSATKPVYINKGVASAVSVDLSTLAPKESPALSGTPTAPTPATSVNNTQLATTAFVQSLLSSRFTASKNDNGWWKDGNTGMIFQFFSYKPTTNYKDAIMPAINFPISFPNKCILVLPVLYNDDKTIYHDIAMQPVSTTNSSVIFYSQLHELNPLQNITGTTIKALAIGY